MSISVLTVQICVCVCVLENFVVSQIEPERDLIDQKERSFSSSAVGVQWQCHTNNVLLSNTAAVL